MKLFARLAEENVGYIDWTKHIPKVGYCCHFNGFQKSAVNIKAGMSFNRNSSPMITDALFL